MVGLGSKNYDFYDKKIELLVRLKLLKLIYNSRIIQKAFS